MSSASDSAGAVETSTLARLASSLATDLYAAIQLNRSIQPLLDACPDPVFIKASDGQILMTNKLDEDLLGPAVSFIGRTVTHLLDESILPVSQSSDLMILDGCPFVEFEHRGLNRRGQPISFHMVKRSLLGFGHPKLAILCVARLLDIGDEVVAQPPMRLSRSWQAFRSLDERDREIAVQIGQGKAVREVAAEMNLSEKTIENRRKGILERMEMERSIELTKLLVRLQDQGYWDFGL